MATKLTNLTLEELSLVDSPANKGARVTIFKREFSDEERERLAETGAAMSDGSYPIETTEDLKNAIQAYGRADNKEAVKRHIIRRARALDAVDMLPDDWEVSKLDDAMEEITKRWIDPADGAKPFSTFLENALDGQRYYNVMEQVGTVIYALDDSLRSIAADNDMDSAAKQMAMRESVEEFMSTMREKWPDVEEAITKAFTDADDGADPAGDPAGDTIGKGGKSMSDDPKTVADLKKQVADLTKPEDLKKALGTVLELAEKAEADKAEAEVLAKMSDAERAHMATLKDDQAKKDFMAMKPEDRQSAMKKATDDDEIVKVGGQDIRKSVVGAAQFAVIKAQQDEITKQAEEIKKEREERQMAELKKRADDEFAHVPGTVDERAAMLKAMGGMDETVRKSFEAVFTAHEKLAKSAFTTVGHGNGDVASGSAEEKLDKLAKVHAEKNSVSYAKAYDAVVQTDEGRELYNQSRAEKSGAAS